MIGVSVCLLQSVYDACRCFAEVKTDISNFFKSPTRFGAVKTASPSFYKPPMHFTEFKTNSPNFHKPPICFVVVKTDSKLIKASETLCSGQNEQASFILCL